MSKLIRQNGTIYPWGNCMEAGGSKADTDLDHQILYHLHRSYFQLKLF